ncbi:MAG: hypothetical protein RLZZ234_765 [Candidatus Parcubacteria bacterium]
MKHDTDRNLVGLIDCNNFFVSCERIFRPDLEGKPVIVLSSNDGCVISRSREVKELGIPMGIPFFEIKHIVKEKGIHLFSSNFTLYRDISSRVMETVLTVVDELEVYSIDEAFFTVRSEKSMEVAHAVRRAVLRHVGVPVSVGIATTKTLAKMAGARAKKGDGIAVLTQHDTMLASAQVGEVWGVGRKTSEHLVARGIATVGDILRHGPTVMREELGIVGEHLYYELTGTPVLSREQRKHRSLMSSRSFGAKVRSFSELADAVTHHLTQIGKKLREQHMKAPGVSLYLRYVDHDGAKRSVSYVTMFNEPLSDTRIMATQVMATLRRVFDTRAAYVKAGVLAHELSDANAPQGSLFTSFAYGANDALMGVVDALNQRFGGDAVTIGTSTTKHAWRSKTQYLSPAYTTSWTDIPHASTRDV